MRTFENETAINALMRHYGVLPRYVNHVKSILTREEHLNCEEGVILTLTKTCPEWFHQ
jgi:hypothetical protein